MQDLTLLMSRGIAAGKTMAEMGIDDTEANRALWDEATVDVEFTKELGGGIGIEPEWPDVDYAGVVEALYDEAYTERLAENLAKRTVTKADESAEGMTLVAKAVKEDRFTLGPMYIPDRMDAHGEWTDATELQTSVWDYVRKGDRRIRLQHNRDIVAGEALEIMAWPYPVEVPVVQKSGDTTPVTFPSNTVFLGVQWEPWAWELVKAGKIRGYSIGGKAERLLVDLPDTGMEKAVEAEPQTPDADAAAAVLSAAITDAMKRAAPVVNVVMPQPRTQRIIRDEHGRISEIVEVDPDAE